jgi:hypothetical protein
MKKLSMAALLFALVVPTYAQETEGTWSTEGVEAGETEYTAVAPLGRDQALNCNRNVIPVKFAVAPDGEDLVLVSDTTEGGETTDDFGVISFDPEEALTVSELTNLTAIYEVLEGNCGGGSLRFQINTAEGNVFVYFGEAPSFTDCSGDEGQSGINLLSLDDARVDSSQVYAGTQVNTWDAFVAANPDLEVESVNLVADGGWSQEGDIQAFAIESVTVNDNTFTGDDLECDLPDATIRVTNEQGAEVDVTSAQGTSDSFREDDCQYIYNLINPGPGTYTVELLIEGEVAASTTFTVACRGNGGGNGNGGNGGGNGNGGNGNGNGGNGNGNGNGSSNGTSRGGRP